MQNISLNIFPKPMPVFDKADDELRRLIDLWSEYVTTDSVEGADEEDWLEQVYRLDACLKTFGKERIILRIVNSLEFMGKHLATGETFTEKDVEGLPVYGARPGTIHTIITDTQETLSDNYMFYQTFTDYAGRQIRMAGNGCEGQCDELVDVVKEFNDNGVHDIFIKMKSKKSGVYRIHIPEVSSIDEVHDILLSDMDWTLVREEGRPNAFCVQPLITMENEYRVFIVDGKPVTGAGCIVEFTPYNNNGKNFDTKLRVNRGENSPVYDNDFSQALVGRYQVFAREVANDFTQEVPDLKNYVMDLATDENGDIIVVELNGILNAGLYATNTVATTDALRHWIDA